MSRCGDDGLRCNDFAAVGAFLTVGQAVFGTGCGIALDGFRFVVGAQVLGAYITNEVFIRVLVTQGSCGALGAADFVGFTFLAVDNILIAARGSAGGGDLIFRNHTAACMGFAGNGLRFCASAYGAASALTALCGAGGLGRDGPCAVAVAVGGGIFVVVLIGAAAAMILGIALLCAGGRINGGLGRDMGCVAGDSVGNGIALACGAAVNIQHHIGTFIEVFLADEGDGLGNQNVAQCGIVAEGVFLNGLHTLLDAYGF